MQQTSNPYYNQSITTSEELATKHNNALKLLSGEKIERELDDLYSAEFQLKRSIPITLHYEDKCYIAIQDTLNLGVEDTSLQGVERKLSIEIIKLYKKLSNLEELVLGPYPKQLLSYLNQYLD